MVKTFEVEVTVPEGLTAGDTFKIEVEVPTVEKKRGQLAGIAIEDMTDDQLKREIINASSVLGKAKKRGADEAVIEKNQARLDAAKALLASRKGTAASTVEAPAVAGVLDGDVETDEETAAEM